MRPLSGLQKRALGAVQYQAGKDATPVSAGVDADAVGPDFGLSRDAVTVNHRRPVVVSGIQEALADPHLVMIGLGIERHAGTHARMHEMIAPFTVADPEAAEELELPGR